MRVILILMTMTMMITTTTTITPKRTESTQAAIPFYSHLKLIIAISLSERPFHLMDAHLHHNVAYVHPPF